MTTKSYRPGPGPRLVNRLFMWVARRGWGADTLHVLTTAGRQSGQPRTVPVHVIEHEDQRWLVAIYGTRSWVHNLRAQPVAKLTRAGRSEVFEVVEVSHEQAGDVLKEYADRIPHVRPYLELPDPSPRDYQELARRHPVFAIQPRPSPVG